jgi:hypothetical protein
MPAEVYQYITLTQAIQQLANRLYDSSMQFWTAAEMQSLLFESLRTWNALTSYWKGDFLFNSQSGVTWYDLTDTVNLPNTLRPLTVTDALLYPDIQYALLEPAVGVNPWAGVSTQFSANDLLNAVQRRRDEILSVTGAFTTRTLIPAVNGRIALADVTIDVRRIAYLPAIGSPSTMWPSDTWDEQSFAPGYLQNPPGTPLTYLLSTQPPITFDTDRAPGSAGQYELLTVNAGPALSATVPTTLIVPDDWTHLIKWGALADLLSRDANAADPMRAQYCEQRYRMGLKLLSSASALLAMRQGNVPVQIDSLRNADFFNPTWEGTAPGTPVFLYHSGLNLMALTPPPNSGSFSLTATVVENAPMPANLADNVQVAREDLDAIIDYAEHIALFKSGGEEFTETLPLFKRFMSQAQLYNAKLSEMGEFTSVLYGLSQRQEQTAPRMVPIDEGGS